MGFLRQNARIMTTKVETNPTTLAITPFLYPIKAPKMIIIKIK